MLKRLLTLSLLLLIIYQKLIAQQWVQISDYPSDERDDGTCFVIGNTAYCGTGLKVGFVPSNDMYMFDMTTETWSAIASLPVGSERQYACGFSSNGKGFIFGGVKGNTYYNDLFCFDTLTGNWQTKTALPTVGRMGSSCFVINNIAYIVGGRTSTNNSIDEVWAYDILADSWVQKNNLPFGNRWRASSVAQGNKGYLLFGYENSHYHKELFEYDPSNDTWTQISTFPNNGRIYTAIQSYNGDLVIIAGLDSLGTMYNDMWRINPTTLIWQQLGSIPSADRKGGMCFSNNTTIYYTTGINQSNTRLKETWKVFNPTTVENINSAMKVSCYPNPSTGKYYLKLPKESANTAINIKVYSILGEQILNTQSQNNSNQIDLSQQPNGVYILKISSDKLSLSQRIIKN